MKLNDINIRDPFILPLGGKYYLYGTRVRLTEEFPYGWGDQRGFDVYESADLINWDGPVSIFEAGGGFWGTSEFWAPEIHIYRDRFYMFASFISEKTRRGTGILVSDDPRGPFEPVVNHSVTPADWDCLDGTLYIDRLGRPHIVFCHEWVQIGTGTVCEALLSDDLCRVVSEPRVLWSATDFKRDVSISDDSDAYITDGPFLFSDASGGLCCLWASFSEKGYCELVSRSDSGEIGGNWTVCQDPVTETDGGHGMLFTDFSGRIDFIMHRPNRAGSERPEIYSFTETHGRFSIVPLEN